MSSNGKNLKRPRGLLKSKKAVGDEPEAKRKKSDADMDDSNAVEAAERTDVTFEDWEDLKELFDNASEALDGKRESL